jgi:mannose-6-phosphate isomerase-like protein (cupin superfamily)
MNRTRLKDVTIGLIRLACIVFITGCATLQKDAGTSPGKVCVVDLKDAAEYQQLLNGKPQTHGMRSGRVYLKPGESCGSHSTKGHEELLVFLAGRGVCLIGEDQAPFEVGEGQVCYIPPCTTHNNKNTGSQPLIYIYCVVPVFEE